VRQRLSPERRPHNRTRLGSPSLKRRSPSRNRPPSRRSLPRMGPKRVQKGWRLWTWSIAPRSRKPASARESTIAPTTRRSAPSIRRSGPASGRWFEFGCAWTSTSTPTARALTRLSWWMRGMRLSSATGRASACVGVRSGLRLVRATPSNPSPTGATRAIPPSARWIRPGSNPIPRRWCPRRRRH